MAGKEVEIQIAREKTSQLTNKTSKEKQASRGNSYFNNMLHVFVIQNISINKLL